MCSYGRVTQLCRAVRLPASHCDLVATAHSFDITSQLLQTNVAEYPMLPYPKSTKLLVCCSTANQSRLVVPGLQQYECAKDNADHLQTSVVKQAQLSVSAAWQCPRPSLGATPAMLCSAVWRVTIWQKLLNFAVKLTRPNVQSRSWSRASVTRFKCL